MRDAGREQEGAHEVRRRARLASMRAESERVQAAACAQLVEHHEVRIPTRARTLVLYNNEEEAAE